MSNLDHIPNYRRTYRRTGYYSQPWQGDVLHALQTISEQLASGFDEVIQRLDRTYQRQYGTVPHVRRAVLGAGYPDARPRDYADLVPDGPQDARTELVPEDWDDDDYHATHEDEDPPPTTSPGGVPDGYNDY